MNSRKEEIQKDALVFNEKNMEVEDEGISTNIFYVYLMPNTIILNKMDKR